MNTPSDKFYHDFIIKTNKYSDRNIHDISPIQLFFSNSITPFLRNNLNFQSDVKLSPYGNLFSNSKKFITNKKINKQKNMGSLEKLNSNQKSVLKLNLNSKKMIKSHNVNINITTQK